MKVLAIAMRTRQFLLFLFELSLWAVCTDCVQGCGAESEAGGGAQGGEGRGH